MGKYKPTDQIGYTCGIYCLIISNCILNKIDFNRDYYYTIIKECVHQSYTKIGEVFDISTLQKIAENFFPNLNAEIHNLTSANDIKNFLNKYIIIMPVASGRSKTPHYILLCQNRYGTIIRYNAAPLIGKYIFLLSDILKKNSSIPHEYIWTKKFLYPSNFEKFLNIILVLILNKNNLQYRKKYFDDIFYAARDHEIIKINDTEPVNMNGRFLLISKNIKNKGEAV